MKREKNTGVSAEHRRSMSVSDPTLMEAQARMDQCNSKRRIAFFAVVALLVIVIGARTRRGAAPLSLSIFPPSPATNDLAPVQPRPQSALNPPASAPSAKPSLPPSKIVVHVAGAVMNPGVYALSPDLRVIDAIRRAGGALPDANLESLNLAARLADGQRIDIPRDALVSANDATPLPRVSPVPGAAAGASGKSRATPEKPVAVNAATLKELETIPGVGPVTAQKILDYRTQNGPFQSPDDLQNVPGIGPKKLERMRPYLQAP